jgi:hypothetical protein
VSPLNEEFAITSSTQPEDSSTVARMVFSHSQPEQAHNDEHTNGAKPSKQALFSEPADSQVQAPSAP